MRSAFSQEHSATLELMLRETEDVIAPYEKRLQEFKNRVSLAIILLDQQDPRTLLRSISISMAPLIELNTHYSLLEAHVFDARKQATADLALLGKTIAESFGKFESNLISPEAFEDLNKLKARVGVFVNDVSKAFHDSLSPFRQIRDALVYELRCRKPHIKVPTDKKMARDERDERICELARENPALGPAGIIALNDPILNRTLERPLKADTVRKVLKKHRGKKKA